MMTGDDAIARYQKLKELNAPPAVLAQSLVFVLFPALARDIGVPAVADQVGRFAAEVLAARLGLCSICKKANPAPEELGTPYPLCPACRDEMDRQLAENVEYDAANGPGGTRAEG